MLFRATVLLFITIVSIVLGLNANRIILGLSSAFVYPVVALIIGSVIIWIDYRLHVRNVSARRLCFSVIGMLLGLTLGLFFGKIFLAVFPAFTGFEAVFSLMMASVGFSFTWLKEHEILFNDSRYSLTPVKDQKVLRPKLLDTSVIIDGRIADISETGFLEGDFIVPRFVLSELQQVADSSDSLKRSRGRRGLDILNAMKTSLKTTIKIVDDDFKDIIGVDAKLLQLAHTYGDAVIITNDYNLNKVAELQGVSILNINELANAVKPALIPNEVIRITVVKEGKDQNQGIAYLDDGTMIVVDNGKDYIGKEILVSVTSVLQTPAGRMIFTQISNAAE